MMSMIAVVAIFSVTILQTSSSKHSSRVLPAGPKGCPLDISLLDKWGDGWKGAKLMAIDNSVPTGPKQRPPKSYAPKPGPSIRTVTLNLSPLAPTILSIATRSGSIPTESWEIWWGFTVDGKFYQGGYNTIISLTCLWESPSDYVIEVTKTEELVEDAKCPKCPPVPKLVKPTTENVYQIVKDMYNNTLPDGETIDSMVKEVETYIIEKEREEEAEYNATMKMEKEREANRNMSIPIADPPAPPAHGVKASDLGVGQAYVEDRKLDDIDSKPKPKPKPAFKYPFLLSQSPKYQWFDGSATSNYYSISDSDRLNLVAFGSLCGPKPDELCQEKLTDGDYVFRVGGATKFTATWEFCGVSGTTQSELPFTVKGGECFPPSYLKVDGTEGSTVTISPNAGMYNVTDTDDEDEDHLDENESASTFSDETYTKSMVQYSSGFIAMMVSSSVGVSLLVVMGFVAVFSLHKQAKEAVKTSIIQKATEVKVKLIHENGLSGVLEMEQIATSNHRLISNLDL